MIRDGEEFGGKPEVDVTGGMTQSQVNDGSGVAVMEVYDQTAFIANRDKKIKQIKQDAQNLNSIATEINGKVH